METIPSASILHQEVKRHILMLCLNFRATLDTATKYSAALNKQPCKTFCTHTHSFSLNNGVVQSVSIKNKSTISLFSTWGFHQKMVTTQLENLASMEVSAGGLVNNKLPSNVLLNEPPTIFLQSTRAAEHFLAFFALITSRRMSSEKWIAWLPCEARVTMCKKVRTWYLNNASCTNSEGLPLHMLAQMQKFWHRV